MTTIFEEIRYIYLIHLEFLVQKIVLVNLFTLNVGKDIIIAIIIHNTKKLKAVLIKATILRHQEKKTINSGICNDYFPAAG